MVKSLQTKYGELPDGWGSYLERVFDSVSGTPKNLIVEASKGITVVVKCKAGTTVRWAYAKNVEEQVDIGFEVTLDVHRQGSRITATSMTARMWWRPAARTCRVTRRASTQL